MTAVLDSLHHELWMKPIGALGAPHCLEPAGCEELEVALISEQHFLPPPDRPPNMLASKGQPLLLHLLAEKQLLGSMTRAKSHDSAKNILDGTDWNLSETQQLHLHLSGSQLRIGVESLLQLSFHLSSDDKQLAGSWFSSWNRLRKSR